MEARSVSEPCRGPKAPSPLHCIKGSKTQLRAPLRLPAGAAAPAGPGAGETEARRGCQRLGSPRADRQHAMSCALAGARNSCWGRLLPLSSPKSPSKSLSAGTAGSPPVFHTRLNQIQPMHSARAPVCYRNSEIPGSRHPEDRPPVKLPRCTAAPLWGFFPNKKQLRSWRMHTTEP